MGDHAGNFWRLIGFAVLVGVVVLVISLAVVSIGGSIGALAAGRMPGRIVSAIVSIAAGRDIHALHCGADGGDSPPPTGLLLRIFARRLNNREDARGPSRPHQRRINPRSQPQNRKQGGTICSSFLVDAIEERAMKSFRARGKLINKGKPRPCAARDRSRWHRRTDAGRQSREAGPKSHNRLMAMGAHDFSTSAAEP
jgi:hypothetical protein